jgi:hypothetical protein
MATQINVFYPQTDVFYPQTELMDRFQTPLSCGELADMHSSYDLEVPRGMDCG